MSEVSKSKFVGSAVWKILESFCSKGITMVVSLVLARLLAPEEFGVISLTSIYISFTDILLQSGFSTALIQKKEATEDDYSTVFAISITCAAILYAAVFVGSPFLAGYFEEPILKDVMRVIGLTIFCQAFGAVRTAVITREMQFRVLFVCTCIANVISGAVGIILAYVGFGVWALVFQQLSQQALLTIILYIRVRIKVRFRFCAESFKVIFPFSMKVLLSSMMSFVADAAYNVAVGKKYSMEDLGYYNRGASFPQQFSLYTFGAISSVLLTALSRHADNLELLKQLLRKVSTTTIYIIFPMMMGLCCVAEPFVSVVLSDKWLPCVGVLQWCCLYFAATPIMLTNVQAHLAIGDGGMRVRQEAIRTVVMFVTLAVLVVTKSDFVILSFAQALIAVFITFISCVEVHRSIGYTLFEQLKDNLSTILCTCGMGVLVTLSGIPFESAFVKLIVQIVVGVGAYVGLSFITKNSGFYNILDILVSRRKQK